MVTATLTFGDYSKFAQSQVVVDVLSRGVEAVIVGGANRTLTLAEDYIVIDASRSRSLDYAVDYIGANAPTLNYSWTCVEYSPAFGNDCGVSMSGEYSDVLTIDNRQSLANDSLSTGFLERGKAYMFTVSVFSSSDTSTISTASTVATVIGEVDGAAVSLTLSDTAKKYK